MTPPFRDIVSEAVIGLSRNRMRAVLSTVGIAWGIVSVVMLLALYAVLDSQLQRREPSRGEPVADGRVRVRGCGLL